jgi:hypothetical protein
MRTLMPPSRPARIRDTVYVIGAGFSAGLDYPMTSTLLNGVWKKLSTPERKQLRKVIEFHHPEFDSTRPSTFPNMEKFLTEIDVNLELFNSSRPAEGRFTKKQLEEFRDNLLLTVRAWFHDLFEDATKKAWLSVMVKRLRQENAAIVSFNWDLILDHLVFEEIAAANYGLSRDLGKGPLLLKPHGSLNWYQGTQIDVVAASKRIVIFHHKDEQKCVHAFVHPRDIESKSGKRYAPLIIPPTYLKDFRPSIFRQLWKNCTDVLSTPKKIVFLGYSLPEADLHAQFIFRCGFYNQVHGRLKADGTRHDGTGPAKVIIVNPDEDAAKRIRLVAGPACDCRWINKKIEDWVL